MAIDLKTLSQKWNELLDDPNFVSDFQTWLNNREKRLSNKKENWIPVDTPPYKSMKVKWLYDDGIEDVGFYNASIKCFGSIDLRSQNKITYWMPFL